MPDIRAMVVMQGGSNLPEDRFINTFHFSGGVQPFDTVVDGIHPQLQAFYDSPHAPAVGVIASRLSPYIVRPASVRYYDLATPEPRIPRVELLALTGPQVATGLNEELAICLSIRGAPPITPRRRGRVFLGPFTTAAVVAANTTTPTRVDPNVLTLIVEAAEDLRQGIIGIDNGNVWAIRSETPAQNFVPVFGGWVDNAVDTQRRRGPDSTARTLWGIPL